MEWWEKLAQYLLDLGKSWMNYDLNRRAIQEGFPPPSDRNYGGFWDFLGFKDKKDNTSNLPDQNTGRGVISAGFDMNIILILIVVVVVVLLIRR